MCHYLTADELIQDQMTCLYNNDIVFVFATSFSLFSQADEWNVQASIVNNALKSFCYQKSSRLGLGLVEKWPLYVNWHLQPKKIYPIFASLVCLLLPFFEKCILPPRNWLYRLSGKDEFTRWSNKRLLQTFFHSKKFPFNHFWVGRHGIFLLLVCFVIIAFMWL